MIPAVLTALFVLTLAQVIVQWCTTTSTLVKNSHAPDRSSIYDAVRVYNDLYMWSKLGAPLVQISQGLADGLMVSTLRSPRSITLNHRVYRYGGAFM